MKKVILIIILLIVIIGAIVVIANFDTTENIQIIIICHKIVQKII